MKKSPVIVVLVLAIAVFGHPQSHKVTALGHPQYEMVNVPCKTNTFLPASTETETLFGKILEYPGYFEFYALRDVKYGKNGLWFSYDYKKSYLAATFPKATTSKPVLRSLVSEINETIIFDHKGEQRYKNIYFLVSKDSIWVRLKK
ncbi:MAG: hypothetical protein PHT40_03745 [Patescibacteria group bacterium]|nr:hypothetical protein [Patescibacteria group bacterium]